jgi:hypothetical protein
VLIHYALYGLIPAFHIALSCPDGFHRYMLLEYVLFLLTQWMLTVLPRQLILVLGRRGALLVAPTLLLPFLQLLDVDSHDLLPKLLLS